jgi:hypothetical protein
MLTLIDDRQCGPPTFIFISVHSSRSWRRGQRSASLGKITGSRQSAAFKPKGGRCYMSRYRRANTEPPLQEVFCEPIVQLLMRRDSVSPEELLQIILLARQRLNHG